MLNPKSNEYEQFVWLDWQRAEWEKALEVGEDGRDKHLIKVFSWPKRFGKTLISALYDVYRCDVFKNQTVVTSGNTKDQATGTAFTYIRDIVEHSPNILERVGARNITNEFIFFPHTESIVEPIPDEVNAVQGRRINVAHKTELGDSKGGSNWNIMVSSVGDAYNGVAICDSTIGEEGSQLNNLVESGLSGDDPSVYVSLISYEDIDDAIANNKSPYISEKFLRNRAAQMLPAEFKRYHLNQAVSQRDLLFTTKDVEAVAVDGLAVAEINKQLKKTILSRFKGGAAYFGFGLDRALSFSKHGDRTVGVVLAKGYLLESLRYFGLKQEEVTPELASLLNDEPFEYWILDVHVFPGSLPGDIQQYIKAAQAQYKRLDTLTLEVYQANDLAIWCSANNLPNELINPTTGVQTAMFRMLHQVVKMGRLRGPADLDLLFAEMVNFPYEMKGDTPRFGLPRKKFVEFKSFATGQKKRIEINDDTIYALALAVYGLREKSTAQAWKKPQVWG